MMIYCLILLFGDGENEKNQKKRCLIFPMYFIQKINSK